MKNEVWMLTIDETGRRLPFLFAMLTPESDACASAEDHEHLPYEQR